MSNVTDKELIRSALDLLSESLCLLYETESSEGHAFAYLVDNALKYGEIIYRDDNVLLASADFTSYENEIYLRERKHLRIIK